MRIAFFDVESTGLDVYRDRIVDIAIVHFDENGKRLSHYDKIINPMMVMSNEVIRIHGITNEQARQGALWDREKEAVASEFHKADVIAGHNILGFDIPILNNHLTGIIDLNSKVIIDTLLLARRYLPHIKKRGLGSVCQAYDVRLDNAHRALPDTVANGQVFFKIIRDLGMTVSDVVEGRMPIGKYNISMYEDPMDQIFKNL